MCLDINEKELLKLKDEFANANNQLHIYKIDLTSLTDIKSVSNKIRHEVGNVNILINNAGIVNSGKLFLDLTEKDIFKIFDVNIFSHIWLCKEFLPDMIQSNKGHIVNMASVVGLMGAYKLTDYSSSKFAVVGFTESLRMELKVLNCENRIVITLICPFHVKTELFKGVEFSRLKWASLSLKPDYVANEIVNGILLNKELLLIPKISTSIFFAIKK